MATCIYPTTLFSRNLSNHPLFSMQREMNKLFEDLVSDDSVAKQTKSFTPRTDIIENEKNFFLTSELPGVEEKDIDISLKDGLLTLRAEKKLVIDKTEKGNHYKERVFGTFERTINLGDQIDEENIVATFKNGVLNLTVPKVEPLKPIEKKINISSASNN